MALSWAQKKVYLRIKNAGGAETLIQGTSLRVARRLADRGLVRWVRDDHTGPAGRGGSYYALVEDQQKGLER